MTDQATADARKVAYKAKLLTEQVGLAAGLATAFAPRIRMIKAATDTRKPHRIMCEDGGWIEIDANGGTVRTWGEGRTARQIATAIAAQDQAFRVEHLEPTATAAALGAPRRVAPVLSDDKLKTLADRWRQRGFTDVELVDDGVWVSMADGTRLHDVGTRVTIHGRITNEALAAMVAKAKSDWNGQHRLHGTWSDGSKERMWLESQRQGVTLLDYQPSPALIARWEAEQAATGRGAGRALRPDAASSPATTLSDGGTPEPESGPPNEVQVGVDEALARNITRAQAELDALHARWAKEARTEADRDSLRKEEQMLNAKLAIYALARALAQAEGLSREGAIRAAYAEAQHRDDGPAARLRW